MLQTCLLLLLLFCSLFGHTFCMHFALFAHTHTPLHYLTFAIFLLAFAFFSRILTFSEAFIFPHLSLPLVVEGRRGRWKERMGTGTKRDRTGRRDSPDETSSRTPQTPHAFLRCLFSASLSLCSVSLLFLFLLLLFVPSLPLFCLSLLFFFL